MRLPHQIRNSATLVPRLLTDTALPNDAAAIVLTRVRADPYKFSWCHIDTAIELWLSRKPASDTSGNRERAWMDQRPARVCEFLPGHRDLLIRAAGALMEWRETTRIPEELTHGDFWLGNVLFNGNDVSGVIAWEWAQMDGLRVVDGLHMLLMSRAVAHKASLAHYLCRRGVTRCNELPLESQV